MRAIRMTVILTLAIPLSILTTVVVMYFIGWSLNMATMMGLLLCIGLVIDNSIVIVENIYRYRQAGLSGRQASIRGAGEVGLAVTTAGDVILADSGRNCIRRISGANATLVAGGVPADVRCTECR